MRASIELLLIIVAGLFLSAPASADSSFLAGLSHITRVCRERHRARSFRNHAAL
jgi:hypothetical protein